MNQPSCEDLRLGKTIEGFHIHSPLGQGPFFRIYGANKGAEEWKLYAWDKLPEPPKESLQRFDSISQSLLSCKNASLISVVGTFSFPDGAVGWAVYQPFAQDGRSALSAGAKKSVTAPGLSKIARGLAASCSAGVMHPGVSIDHLWFSSKEPQGLVGGFFSWRRLYPGMAQFLPPEEALSSEAPEGNQNEASLVYSLAFLSQEFGFTPPSEALAEDPAKRPRLLALADFFSSQTPGLLGRLLGR